MDLTYALILFVVGILCVILYRKYSDHNSLPGPWGWPIFGNLFSLGPMVYKHFNNLRNQYGDVFAINIGMRRCIILNSYPAIKEALMTKADNFVERPIDDFVRRRTLNSGIVFVNGELWRQQRRFLLQTLRDFGMGKRSSEEIILYEAEGLVQILLSQRRVALDPVDTLLRSVTNVICTLTFGEQPGSHTNDNFMKVFNDIRVSIATPDILEPPIMFPFLGCVSFLLESLPSVKLRIQNVQNVYDYVGEKIDNHRRNIKYDEPPRDILDVYLQEQERLNLIGSQHNLTDKQIIRSVYELFIAGTDTTANSLAWALVLVAIYSNVQRKIHNEIDRVVGKTKRIIYQERNNLPYCQAVLSECLRFGSITPYGISRRNSKSDIIQGINIPANSYIIPCIYSAHQDPRIWERSADFYPEHFLTENGNYKQREELIPFSLGKRNCLGESLARMEIFIFFTHILQKFEVSLENNSNESKSLIMAGKEGFVRSPGSCQILMTPLNEQS